MAKAVKMDRHGFYSPGSKLVQNLETSGKKGKCHDAKFICQDRHMNSSVNAGARLNSDLQLSSLNLEN